MIDCSADEMLENVNRKVASFVCSESGLIVSDLNDNIIFINRLAEKIIGLKEVEVIGRSIKIISPNFNTDNTLKSGCSEKVKIAINSQLCIINKIPFLDEQDQIIGTIILLNDISDLFDELEKNQQISRELDVILDSIYDGIIITDGEGVVWRANKAYQELAGVTESDYVGKHVRQLVEQRFVTRSVVEKIIETKKAETMIQKIKSGKELLNSGVPIFNNKGDMSSIVTIVRDLNELNNIKEQLFRISEENKLYQDKLRMRNGFDNDYVIYSKKMQEIFEMIDRIAKYDSSVLITGESGVGKEVIAEYIYKNSYRKDAPYIKVNCGAIAESLIESELFGYESGSFTGALKGGKKGLLEKAQHGTILFDEIAELPLNLQVKLLRVLQEREFCRVGGTRSIGLDCRFLFATNKDLRIMVEQGTFREDLFYRCNVVVINIPPLRDRKEDINALVMRFIKKFNERYNQQKRITKEALAILNKYDWPGNIREMQNVIERLVVSYQRDFIDSDCLEKLGLTNIGKENLTKCIDLNGTLEAIEKELVMKAYNETGCTRKASIVLGINQSTVVKKMKKYGIKAISHQIIT